MNDKIYFGHSVNVYGTPDEERLIKIIEEYFPQFEVENPNQLHHQEGYQRWRGITKGMDYYFKEVLPQMESGIFLPFEDGMLGAGVYGEAEFIANDGKLIYEIDFVGNIERMFLDSTRKLSVSETRERVYGKG
jgi:hypothetical protein